MSAQSVAKEKLHIIDQGGYELAKMPRKLGQFTVQIFTVEEEGSGDSIPKELSKGSIRGEDCSN